MLALTRALLCLFVNVQPQLRRRRQRGSWDAGSSARKKEEDGAAGPNDSVAPPAPVFPVDVNSVIEAVAAEVGTTQEWLEVSAGMMEMFSPSVCRPGAADYVRQLSTADESDTLRWIRAETVRRFAIEEASMQIFPEQGKWLSQLVLALNAQRVLEIGSFTGYSSTCIAAALPSTGKLQCCDISHRYTALAQVHPALRCPIHNLQPSNPKPETQ
jgi:hypothetical protein